MSGDERLTEMVKTMAMEAGFSAVAIASPSPPGHGEGLRRWLDSRRCAGMEYMRRDVDKRLDPRSLFDGLASVICLAAAMEYEHNATAPKGSGVIARYARGKDYHKVLKTRCIALMDRIKEVVPGFDGKAFVGSAPVMERTLAATGGLGWIGKNGCLFVPGRGSYVSLCEIFCNLSLQAGEPMPSPCGDCRLCVDACPTGALSGDGLVDARLCISFHTIENNGTIPRELWPKFGARFFGCDACQEVCPHNSEADGDRKAADRQAASTVNCLPLAEILSWNESDWDRATRGKAIRRAGYSKFLRNAIIAAGNSGCRELVGSLRRIRNMEGLTDLIDWAIAMLQTSNNKD